MFTMVRFFVNIHQRTRIGALKIYSPHISNKNEKQFTQFINGIYSVFSAEYEFRTVGS